MKNAQYAIVAFFSLIFFTLVGVLIFLAKDIGFFYDDWMALLLSHKMPSPLFAFNHDQMLGTFFRPVGVLWWWLLAQLGDPTPQCRHIISVFLHAAGSLTLGVSIGYWKGDHRHAIVGALLWLLSPVAISCVSWLSCTFDLLAILFSTWCILFALLFMRRSNKLHLFLALGFGLAAMWSKESAYLLPFVALPISYTCREGKRKNIRALLIGFTTILSIVLLHRRFSLGLWMGGYNAESASFDPHTFYSGLSGLLSEQAPGILIRLFLILSASLMLIILLGAVSKKAIFASLLASLFACVPLIIVFKSPMLLNVMPLRYFAYSAFTFTFFLCHLAELDGLRKYLGYFLLATFMISGLWTGMNSLKFADKTARIEMGQIESILRHAQLAAQQERKIQIEPWRSVIGMDAAVKALDDKLIDKVVVLACGAPTQVVTSPQLAAELDLPWSTKFKNNPSRAYGLVWGEAILPESRCKKPSG